MKIVNIKGNRVRWGGGIKYLLTQADTRTGVEWKEDEGVVDQVLLQSVIKEAVGIEFLGW